MRPITLAAGLALALAGNVPTQPVMAQTPQERARIDYEAAKIALEQGRHDAALASFERVLGVLGDNPDLLLLTTKAAFQAGEISRAREYLARTFAAANEEFKAGESYGELIRLAAQIEVAGPELEARQALEREYRQARQRGYWHDQQTGLLWTIRDNGFDIDWNRANQHCRDLSLGGLRGWRLPSIEELSRIFDGRSQEQLKIRGPITLSNYWVWSGTMNGSSEAWGLLFGSGRRDSGRLGGSGSVRALCVRVPER